MNDELMLESAHNLQEACPMIQRGNRYLPSVGWIRALQEEAYDVGIEAAACEAEEERVSMVTQNGLAAAIRQRKINPLRADERRRLEQSVKLIGSLKQNLLEGGDNARALVLDDWERAHNEQLLKGVTTEG